MTQDGTKRVEIRAVMRRVIMEIISRSISSGLYVEPGDWTLRGFDDDVRVAVMYGNNRAADAAIARCMLDVAASMVISDKVFPLLPYFIVKDWLHERLMGRVSKSLDRDMLAVFIADYAVLVRAHRAEKLAKGEPL